MKVSILFACLIWSAAGAHPADAQSRYVHGGTLTSGDGLSQAYVSSIVQGKQGFMWIGTKHGLDRYDGYKFHVFGQRGADGRSTAGAFISSVHIAADSDIWVGTYSSGLTRICPATDAVKVFIHHASGPGSLPGNSVQCLAALRNGDMAVGLTNKGCALYEPSTRSFVDVPFEERTNSTVYNICQDREGNLWLVTADSPYSFSFRTRRSLAFSRVLNKSRGPDSVWAMRLFLARNGRLWAATRDGLDTLDYARMKWCRVKTSENGFLHVWIDRITNVNGNLGLVAMSGFYIFDPWKKLWAISRTRTPEWS